MAYCQVSDLLTGSIPLPVAPSPQQAVDNAAEEIDAALGQVYLTPIVLSPVDPAVRPSLLTLKHVNAKLATGRLILAVAGGTQDTELNAYGLSLLKEARATLSELRASSESLPGAILAPTAATSKTGRGPRISNVDPVSQVDAFYDYFNPLVNPPTVI